MGDLKELARVMLDALPQFDDEQCTNITTDDLVCTIVKALAEVRAETEARVVEAAVGIVTRRVSVAHIRSSIVEEVRALAPGDYVAVRREDFTVIADAAKELEARIRMERMGYESSRADEIRAALSRAGKGE